MTIETTSSLTKETTDDPTRTIEATLGGASQMD